MRPHCPPVSGWAASCSWPSPAWPPATAAGCALQGRIWGAQTQREDLAALPAPAHTERPRRRSLESPDLHVLCGEALAVLRHAHFQTGAAAGARAPDHVQRRLPPTGQGTASSLSPPALVPPRGIRRALGAAALSLFVDRTPGPGRVTFPPASFSWRAWEKIGRRDGARPAVRPGTRRPGVRDEVPQRRDAYETSKFAEGLSHLTLSDGLWRLLRARPVMGERRLAQRNTPPAGFSSGERFADGRPMAGCDLQAVPGDGRSGASARPPAPGCLKTNSVHERSTHSG